MEQHRLMPSMRGSAMNRFGGRTILAEWNITDRILLPFEGVGLSVHVSFSSGDELGSVTFHGAGAQFNTIEGLF